MLSSGLLPNFIEGVAKKISKAEEAEDSSGLLLISSYIILVLVYKFRYGRKPFERWAWTEQQCLGPIDQFHLYLHDPITPTRRLADEIGDKIKEMDGKYKELTASQQTLMADDAPERPGPCSLVGTLWITCCAALLAVLRRVIWRSSTLPAQNWMSWWTTFCPGPGLVILYLAHVHPTTSFKILKGSVYVCTDNFVKEHEATESCKGKSSTRVFGQQKQAPFDFEEKENYGCGCDSTP